MNYRPADPLVQIQDDIAEDNLRPAGGELQAWKILIVDDESEVHDATVFALANLLVLDRGLEFLHAKTEAEAQLRLQMHTDVAVVLLDVVMDSGDSGLRLARHIREKMRLDAVRIVLRTGQPGYAPELEVIQKYDINDYKTKLELTRTRLATTIIAAIRSYSQIRTISINNANLELKVRERTSELQHANQELESYSYCVAHDLRAPLRHIQGFGTILESKLGARLEGEDRKLLDKIMNAAKRMSQLIDDLLEFTRVGRTSLKLGDVDLNAIVADVVHETQPDIGKRAISWKIAALPPVFADKSLLRQVMTNLISNAVKYTGGRDEARIEIGIVQEGSATTFFVRDNGVGFDMKHADRLFKPFSRLHTYAEFEGTGVGLSIVSKIIERHDGTLRVEARKDEGATFYFSLPDRSARAATY